MESLRESGCRSAAPPYWSLLLIAAVAMGMQGCGPSNSGTVEARPEQAGQPVNPIKMARHITGARASAVLGDSKAAEAHVRAMADDVLRSARVSDPFRPINHEAARTAVRPLPGVHSSVWLDHENFIVMVNGARYHTLQMIDKVCLALQPLGDTLAVVVNAGRNSNHAGWRDHAFTQLSAAGRAEGVYADVIRDTHDFATYA